MTFLARFFAWFAPKKNQDGQSPSWLLPVTFRIVLIGLSWSQRHFITRRVGVLNGRCGAGWREKSRALRARHFVGYRLAK